MLEEVAKSIVNSYRVNLLNEETFDLFEHNPNSICKIARFKKKNGKVLVYKFDRVVTLMDSKGQNIEIKTIFPFFNDSEAIKGLKAMADYIIFYQGEINANINVIICNMKSELTGNNKNQMDAAEHFVYFILNSINRQFHKSYKIKIRKVLFTSKTRGIWYDNYRKNNNMIMLYQSNGDNIETCQIEDICNS